MTNYITWNTEEESTIEHMNLDTLVLLMEREDANRSALDTLENDYVTEYHLDGEAWDTI